MISLKMCFSLLRHSLALSFRVNQRQSFFGCGRQWEWSNIIHRHDSRFNSALCQLVFCILLICCWTTNLFCGPIRNFSWYFDFNLLTLQLWTIFNCQPYNSVTIFKWNSYHIKWTFIFALFPRISMNKYYSNIKCLLCYMI